MPVGEQEDSREGREGRERREGRQVVAGSAFSLSVPLRVFREFRGLRVSLPVRPPECF